MKLDIWSIGIIIIIFQGIFLLSILLVSAEKRRKRGNIFLFALILAFLWFLSEFLAIRTKYDIGFDLFYGTRYGSWFLLGPLTLFFFRSVTTTQRKFSKKDALHFFPFLVFVLIVPLLSSDTLSSRQIHYGMLAVFDHRKKVVTPFEYLYSVLFVLQFVHLGGYLVYNQIRISSYSEGLKREYSNINQVIWLKILNLLLMATLMLASVYLYVLFASDFYRRFLDYIYVLPMGFFIYSVGYRMAGIHWPVPTQKEAKYVNSSLTEDEKADYAERIKRLMQQDKPYLKNDLRLKELATLLQMSTHHLSQTINETYDCSFFDLINRYRVQEAKEIIRSQPRLTMLQVTFDAGFNNKTSFVNAFKKFEKMTPSQFRQRSDNS
ncbi:helix-turn-helix domain-containing protein [Flavobacteriaceae bacterium 3-367]